MTKKNFKYPKYIKIILRKKLTLYRSYQNDNSLQAAYKQASQEYETAVKHWNESIENDICQNPTNRKFYNFINKKLKTTNVIPTLIDSATGDYIFSDSEKASLLNSCFQKVFTTDDGNLPKTTNTNLNMPEFTFIESDVLSATLKMKDKLTRTPESIPTYFIRRIIHCILKPLLHIYNTSLKHSIVPCQWKNSYIVPIFKKGNKSNPTNYRPISLTSTFSRIFESVLHDKI